MSPSIKLPVSLSGIPLLGFGTGTKYFKTSDNKELNQSLLNILDTAVHEGFIHIDTAESYGISAEIAAFLKNLKNIKRKQLFITDKFDSVKRVGYGSADDASPYAHLKNTLDNVLHTDYVDLYLLHAPFITEDKFGFTLEEAWQSVEKLYDEGLAKRIGVSNFSVEDLKRILKIAKHQPQVNQIEFNVFLQNQTPDIVEFSKKNNITVEAYSPLAPLNKGDLTTGVGKKLGLKLDELEKKYKKSKTQLLLRWVIQQGIVPISTTSKVSRLDEWKGVFDFTISDEDEETITNIGKEQKPQLRLYWKPLYDKYN